ncbi:uncharacterized protein LOC130898947 [Diorhabda carinulata]|uniref:uncharacterized protein LOC130898947 n=1 Tax=Diorhabda carinulata TaxID=1163345 RepID=UPI0025A11AAE|nr:uncharacterized protein LOC130898947 [Diorhabda carinulata]
MDGLREIIRRLMNPILPERNRKRRALDSPPCSSFFAPKPKLRRLQGDPLKNSFDFDREFYFVQPIPLRKTSIYKTPSSRNMETANLIEDDDEEVINVKTLNGSTNLSDRKFGKFTSTPHNSTSKRQCNETDGDVCFVKEVLSPMAKKYEATKKGLNYVRPSSGGISKYRTSQIEKRLKERTNLFQSLLNDSSSSIRLNDKMMYRKLLQKSKDFSKSPLFNYDTANITSGTIATTTKSKLESSNKHLSTKDVFKKVLNNWKNDTIIIKDSDSEPDAVIVNPPSPKPDIKVDPINTFKKVVDTAIETRPEWLENLVNRHQKLIAERKKEIDYLRDCSEKHGKINKDMRMEALTQKINKSLQIRDVVLPIEETEEDVEFPPLTEAHSEIINKAFRGDPNEILCKKFNLNITRRDLLTIAGLNWLNDEVINFYMNLIMERAKHPKWPKAYAFNTFFYPKLLKDGHQSLRRWTKKVDIFEYALICVPIHLGMHWCMAIIDFRAKSIRYYDSMGSSNNKCLDALKKYLEAEHLDKKKIPFDTSDFELENVKDIPQQMNGSDCGMFSCTFAEFLTRDAKIVFSQEHMPYLRKKMVVEIMTGELLVK